MGGEVVLGEERGGVGVLVHQLAQAALSLGVLAREDLGGAEDKLHVSVV